MYTRVHHLARRIRSKVPRLRQVGFGAVADWLKAAPGSTRATRPSLSPLFDDQGFLRSPLWLDQPDYDARIAERRSQGTISAAEGSVLGRFAAEGFAIIDLDLDEAVTDTLRADLEMVWRTRPRDLLAAVPSLNDGRPLPMSALDGNAERLRQPRTRILDLHSHSEAAKFLYLMPQIHRLMALILEKEPVATQSLYFEHGSTQALHRDPWFVVTRPTYNLVAVWIGLEDVHADAGPLMYVPGSHRLPYHLTALGDVVLHGPHLTADDRERTYRRMHDQIAAHGLEVASFTPRRGQALIWHYGLAHGGRPVADPARTRHSFVVHFDAAGDRPRRGLTLTRAGEPHRQLYTTRKLWLDGAQGFDNPLRVCDLS